MIFIGPLPPPVHGMAAMNKSVCDRLLDDGINVKKINTAPKTLNRNLFARLSRIPAIGLGWFHLLRWCWKRQSETVYITLSGGWGQIYDLLMVVTSRILDARIIFHHHTYAFLLNWKWLSALIFRFSGSKTFHVVLCSKMAEDLFDQYGVDNSIVVSNLAAMPLLTGEKRKKIRKIGFIGNITVEKGGEHVIDLAKAIYKKGLPIQVVVAGPCPEPKLKDLLILADKDDLLYWHGPIYNEQKDSFFASIDALVMPTQYFNEAEPLVVWEALGSGSPVIAYNRGCIPSQIKNGAGVTFPKEKDFVKETILLLEHWLANPDKYVKSSVAALRIYREALVERELVWNEFREVILN